ncbi:MAG: FAD-dependent oxidoreductase [Jannaschia sp.]
MPRHDVAALTDIPENKPFKGTAGDIDVLLIRRGVQVTALTHDCPHYGLPLSEGVVHGDTIICPFHHACFSTRTGEQMQPPGHGNLKRYETAVEDGRVWVTLNDDEDGAPATRDHVTKDPDDARHFVIAGTGAAGMACAFALREEGFTGQITMIAPGAALPINRTGLSKEVIAGEGDVEVLADKESLSTRDVAVIDGEVVATSERHATLADGTTVDFDALLLAPGGIARKPDLAGVDLPGVHRLRSAEDAQAIADAAGSAKSAILVGGGFIGMEGALSLAKRGLDVTVILREEVPLASVLGDLIGRAVMAEHEAEGVTFRTGVALDHVTGDGKATGVALDDGSECAADLVILALGMTPATDRIGGIPSDDDGGITVEGDLSVPGRPGLFAAGDVARTPTAFGPARIEHWRVALQHGRRAALSMLGKAASGTDVPFFWTALKRQYRYVGHAEGWDEIIFDGDPAKGPFLARFVKGGKTVAAVGAGRDADLASLHLDMAAAGGPIP